jgi:hypothetical protein
MYIPIKNRQGGGADISSLFREKSLGGQKETFVKYRDKDSTPEVYGSKKGA